MSERYPDYDYETGGGEVLMWALWSGLGVATLGEILLFVSMDAAETAGRTIEGIGIPAGQLTVVASLSALMVVLAFLAKAKEVGGGGLPTAMISWMLVKSVGISGLVVYQLANNHVLYWPFLGVFIIGMLIFNPTRFQARSADR